MFNSKRIRGWFNWKKQPTVALGAAPETVNPLAAAATSTDRENRVREGNNSPSTADRHPADRPRRRRRRRREPSPTGLPLYAEEPHDDEMSLFKHDGAATSSRVDLRDLYPSGGSSLNGGAGGDDGASSIYRPSMDVASLVGSGRGRSASDAPSAPGSLYAYPSTPPRQFSDFSNELTRPGMGHRSTQSSSSLSAASPPLGAGGRNRSSTLRSLFTRNDSASVLSSSPGSTRGRSPYGQGGEGSTSPLASASSASVNSSRISAPLQHTLVSSSFVFPKSGPTASQLAFISSRENLGAYGYGDGVAQIPLYDDGPSSPPLDPLPAPSPALLPTSISSSSSSSSMAVPVPGGRFRASSVSSQLSIVSSPLSRSHSPTPSDDDSDPDSPNNSAAEREPPIPSYDELHPPPPSLLPSSSSSAPSLPPLILAPQAAEETPTTTPRSGSPVDGQPSQQAPKLPSLVFDLATPTGSPVVGGPMPFAMDDLRRDLSEVSDASWSTARSGGEATLGAGR